jgi:hypothetical protein
VGTFDEAADRRIEKMRLAANDASDRAITAEPARQRAADELAGRLRELASYLMRNTRPASIEIRPKYKWNKPAVWSPEGFLLSADFRINALGPLRSIEILLSDGRLWEFREDPYFDPKKDVSGYVPIKFEGTFGVGGRESAYLMVAGIKFSASLTSGALLARVGRDPEKDVDPTDALAACAANIVEHGVAFRAASVENLRRR